MINIVNTEFSSVEVWFTDQASKALEIENNVDFYTNYWVVIIKMRYSTEPRSKKYFEGYGFSLFARELGNKYGKKLMDNATKTGVDAAKTASRRVIQKIAEASGDFIGNKIADKLTSIGKRKKKKKQTK